MTFLSPETKAKLPTRDGDQRTPLKPSYPARRAYPPTHLLEVRHELQRRACALVLVRRRLRLKQPTIKNTQRLVRVCG